MTTTYIGEFSLGDSVPGVMPLVAFAQSQLTAQLNATIAMQANVQLPTNLLQLIELAKQMLANLERMLALGLQPPTINAQLGIIVSTIAAINLQLAPYLAFGATMAVAGVFGYVYDGPTNGAGAELATALAAGFPGHGATDHCNLLVLGCVAGVTWTAMQAIFKTSP